jgi:hypothetical protein
VFLRALCYTGPMPDPELSPETNAAAMKILKNPKVLKGLSTPGRRFDRAGLLSELFDALAEHEGEDGQRALAKIMVAEYFAGKSGGVARQRILDSWCRLINWHSDDVHQVPVEEMTEEELIHAIDAALPKLRVIAETDELPEPPPRPKPVPPPPPPPEVPARPVAELSPEVRAARQANAARAREVLAAKHAATPAAKYAADKARDRLAAQQRAAQRLAANQPPPRSGESIFLEERPASIEALDFTQLGFSSPEEEGEPEN